MTSVVLVGLVCAGSAGWLLGGGTRPRRGRGCPPATLRRSAYGSLRRPGPLGAACGAGLLGWAIHQVGPGTVLPLGVTVAVAGAAAFWLHHRARVRRAAGALEAEVVEACEAVASGLRAGLAPEQVLAATSGSLPVLRPAATADRLGGDVPSALRASAATAGASRLGMLAAAWDVARRSGAGLAEAVTRIAAAVRADQGRSRQVDAALAGARSTARLFAVLPVLGVALGSGMGADPVAVLTTSPAGAWALCMGTVLAVAGLVWVERLADGAVR